MSKTSMFAKFTKGSNMSLFVRMYFPFLKEASTSNIFPSSYLFTATIHYSRNIRKGPLAVFSLCVRQIVNPSVHIHARIICILLARILLHGYVIILIRARWWDYTIFWRDNENYYGNMFPRQKFKMFRMVLFGIVTPHHPRYLYVHARWWWWRTWWCDLIYYGHIRERVANDPEDEFKINVRL